MRVGRFAPSPTGPLHMGSLITALASFLDIKQQQGNWSIRIDDLDHPRNDPEATDIILDSLQKHGLNSDTNIVYQSQNLQIYKKAISRLHSSLFRCICSRKSLAKSPIYPGTCRNKKLPNSNASIRIKMPNEKLAFIDKIRGRIEIHLAEEIGDLILVRRDKIFSYNLATSVDDGSDTITDVLRGQDLLPLTNQQIFLMNKLNLRPPEYAHIPVLCYPDGTKLSKQSGAKPLNNETPIDNITLAIKILGQKNPPTYINTVLQLIEWAIDNWDIENLPQKLQPYQWDNG